MNEAERSVDAFLDSLNVTHMAQFRLGPYRVDQFLPPNSVLEIDGPYHDTPEGRKKDKERDRWLKHELGFRVLRIKWGDVISNIAGPLIEQWVLRGALIGLQNEAHLRTVVRRLRRDLRQYESQSLFAIR